MIRCPRCRSTNTQVLNPNGDAQCGTCGTLWRQMYAQAVGGGRPFGTTQPGYAVVKHKLDTFCSTCNSQSCSECGECVTYHCAGYVNKQCPAVLAYMKPALQALPKIQQLPPQTTAQWIPRDPGLTGVDPPSDPYIKMQDEVHAIADWPKSKQMTAYRFLHNLGVRFDDTEPDLIRRQWKKEHE